MTSALLCDVAYGLLLEQVDRYVLASLFTSGEGDFTDARTSLREMLEAPLLRAPGTAGLTREEYELRQELGIA